MGYLWKGFYDEVLESRHGFPPAAVHTTDLDYTKVDTSKLPADLNDYCVSTRIRAARNISGFGLPPGSTREERREVARIAEKGLSNLTGELAGKYYSLETLGKADSDSLRADHFLFQIPNSDADFFKRRLPRLARGTWHLSQQGQNFSRLGERGGSTASYLDAARRQRKGSLCSLGEGCQRSGENREEHGPEVDAEQARR